MQIKFNLLMSSWVLQNEKPEYVVEAMLGPSLKPGDTVIVAGSGAGDAVRSCWPSLFT